MPCVTTGRPRSLSRAANLRWIHLPAPNDAQIAMLPTTRISIDRETYILAEDCDVGDLMGRIEAASQTAASFVTFASRLETVSALITPYTSVTVSVDHPADGTPSPHTGTASDGNDGFWSGDWD